jgi:hypothetical protein
MSKALNLTAEDLEITESEFCQLMGTCEAEVKIPNIIQTGANGESVQMLITLLKSQHWRSDPILLNTILHIFVRFSYKYM